MGYAKQRQLEEDSNGFSSIYNKYVCQDCFDDYAIKNFIRSHASKTKCDYCGKTSTAPISADVNDIMELLIESIQFEWNTPGNEDLMYVTAEGGWIGETIDKYDLFEEIDLSIEDPKLFDDIRNSIIEEVWCERDFHSGGEDGFLRDGWYNFSETIKYKSRYVFLKKVKNKDLVHDYGLNPDEMLDSLGKVFRILNLETVLKAGDNIYRVRVHNPEETLTTLEELGPPEAKDAISLRMSPVGIPMMYAALDKETCIKETYTPSEEDKRVTCATFEVLQKIKILDLTNLPSFPSLFDEANRHKRAPLMFVKDFISDISQLVNKDDKEHLEYYPTQVFSEYLRHIYRDNGDEQVLGILYRSSVHEGGKSLVLFMERDALCDKTPNLNKNPEKYIKLISKVTIDPKLKI